MKPDSANHNPSPDYLRHLIAQVADESLMHEGKPSQQKIAKRLGIPPRTFRDYLKNGTAKYTVQYALEQLVEKEEEATDNTNDMSSISDDLNS